jgi:hypothetical protein
MNIKQTFLLIFTVLIIVLTLFVPKIILRNNIYYLSKDLDKDYLFYISLKEENKFLQQQLEDAKFKNQIMDSIILGDIIIDGD